MQSRLAILIENTAPIPGLIGEFGFSVYLNWQGQSFLLDTGNQGHILANARVMGIDLQQLAGVVISHGHFDHVGGLPYLLEMKGETPIYLHPQALDNKLAKTGETTYTDIGFTRNRDELERMGAIFYPDDKPRELAPGLILAGTIPRIYSWEDTGGPFYLAPGEPDPLYDDQALIIDSNDGLLVVSGCAHSGMANTAAYARSLFPGKSIKAYIGGTHLISASPERLRLTRDAINELEIQEVVACHCTGFAATAYLYRELGPARLTKGECGYTRMIG
ncbi:MAG: MBL fold metallo-hydrolase [Methanomassiliicoccales archaeon]